MKKINDIKDINLDDFESILLDLENYPKDFCSEEVKLIRQAINQVKNDISNLKKGKGADEIIVTDRAIKLTIELFKLYDLLKDDLINAEERYNSVDNLNNTYNFEYINNEYYKGLEALYKNDDEGDR